MKTAFFLFLLLLPPMAASAQPEFPLSCGNVTKIMILRLESKSRDIPSENGRFHILLLWLAKEAGERLQALRESLPPRHGTYRGDQFYPANILLLANGAPLQSAAPEWDALTREYIAIAIVREEDAFQAARMVCPALVPEKALIDGQVPWQEFQPPRE